MPFKILNKISNYEIKIKHHNLISLISGITFTMIIGSLEQALPRLNFVDITEKDLEPYKSKYKDSISPKEDVAEILIADNSFIGPLIYNESLPFKFIQVCLHYTRVPVTSVLSDLCNYVKKPMLCNDLRERGPA